MKNFIKNSIVASMVAMAITACGGGSSGGNSNNGGEAKTGLKFTPVTDVSAVVGTQGIQLASVRKSSGIDFISSAYADDVSTTVSLVATDTSGNTFNVGFTDVEGNPASESVSPTGMVRLDDDHAMVELFVLTNAASNAREYRHYLVEYSTGKMILVETLAALYNAWGANAVSYAAGPNSLHNATSDILYRKEDTKWYKLTPNWDDLTFSEVAYADSTGEDKTDIARTLPMPNGDLFTVTAGKVYHNGNLMDTGEDMVMSVFQKDGQAYAMTNYMLFNITSGSAVQQAELPKGNYGMVATAVSFDGVNINLSNCSTYAVNGDVIDIVYNPSDRDSVSYDAVMAGSDMMCTGIPKATSSMSAKKMMKAARSAEFTESDAVCDLVNSWTENGGVRLIHVSNNTEQRVDGAEGVYATIPMSRDTAYMSQIVCTPAGGDGVASAKWSLTYADSKVDFVNNEISPLSAPVVMSIVN